MWSATIPSSISIPKPSRHADVLSSRVLFSPSQFPPVSFPSGISTSPPATSLTIRMGGGPRTYPGGVSKWQWKRMQAKKAKQLLKARLCRERQIYEMRKRAELKAAVSELERPWEVVERAPTLFSVKADEQVKVLADRFQKPGGFDMWTDRDGPQVFRGMDGLPSARFFPKGVVHSVRPYGVVSGSVEGGEGGLGPEDGEGMASKDRIGHGRGGIRNTRKDRTTMRRRNGSKLGSLSSRDVGRDSRNFNSSCGGNEGFGGESVSSGSGEEVLDSVDQIQKEGGGGRTSSSDCSDQHQSRWQQNGRLMQEGDSDSRFEGSRFASSRFGRKGSSHPNPRDLEFPSARGRMIDDGKQNDEGRFSFDSSKSSSLNLPADSNELYFRASADHGNRRRQAILRGLGSDEIMVNNGEGRRVLDKEDSNKSGPERGFFTRKISPQDEDSQISGVRCPKWDEEEDTKAL